MNKNFEQWPLGRIPEHLQRVELKEVKKLGYQYNDARELVEIFEDTIADFTGAKYAVAVDNCTDAIFLVLDYYNFLEYSPNAGEISAPPPSYVEIPSRIYPSVPMALIQNGFKIKFVDQPWSGIYQLKPYNLFDSATRFTKDMYIKDSIMCLSFQLKKRLFIGKGGMILLNDKKMYDWLIRARYQGRDLTVSQWDDEYSVLGYNMYMTPEDAARGLIIFNWLMQRNPSGVFEDTATQDNYADMSKKKIFSKYLYNQSPNKINSKMANKSVLGSLPNYSGFAVSGVINSYGYDTVESTGSSYVDQDTNSPF